MTKKCENCIHEKVCGVLFPNNCPFYLKEHKQGEWIERLEWLKQKEPKSMSPSYEYIKGWNDAIDAIVERMKEGDEK